MPALRTYSFSDVDLSFLPVGYKAFNIKGQGAGSISYDYITENTAHDIAADGIIMPSKIRGNNGHINIVILQTSPLHQTLVGLFQYLMFTAPTSQWAAMQINLSTLAGALEEVQFKGVSFAKPAGVGYEAKGGQITWNMMATDIVPVGIAVPTVATSAATQIKNNI